jgi:hypothetical protein
VGDVLIDLGEQHGRLPDVAAPGARRHRFRAALAALSAALLISLSGAAALPAPAAPVIVPARLGDTMFVEQNRLYLVGAGPELNDPAVNNRIVSMYALPTGRLLSRTTVAVTGAVFQATSAGDTVLVSYQVDTVGAEATVALAAGTDRALWRAPARLLSVSSREGLVLLRENRPNLGEMHWFGVDLATGRPRWTFEQPVQGYTTEAGYDDAGFPHRLITATTAGHIEVRDTATGALVTAADVPAPAGWSRRGVSVWPVGDLMLVGGAGGTTAYALADLGRRWSNDVGLSGRWVQDCAAICVFGYRGGVQVLDPVTGRVRWAADRWTAAERAGGYLLVNGNKGLEGSYPLAVVEPETGALHGDFGEWRTAGTVRADGTVVGLRQRIGDDVVFYALLNPGTLAARLLGEATYVSGDCQPTTDVLVCRRLDASVAIWPLTES